MIKMTRKNLYDEQERGPYRVLISLEKENMNTKKDKNHIKI